MFFPNRIIVAFVLVGIGMAPQFAAADSPNSRKDLLSMMRSYKSPVAKHEEKADGASVISNHRLAKTYAAQNDAGKANTHFGAALQNAAPKQIPAIAADYAAFLADTGDLHKAELVLRQALTQAPHDAELTKMLARCLVLQDKVIEGLRYFKSIYSEAEAKAEIAAIYREQGDTESLAAVEKKWGTPGTARPEPVRSEPVLLAVRPEPPVQPVVQPVPIAASKPAALLPIPTMRTETAISPPAEMVNILPSPKQALSPVPIAANREEVAQKEEVAVIAATPIEPLHSKPEFLSAKIPIPVPNSVQQPVITIARLPKSASSAPIPRLPAPVPIPLMAETLILENPARLPVVSAPPVPAQQEAKEPPRPTVFTQQPRKHYVVNANTAADLDALFPVESVAATVPIQKPERPMLLRR